MQKTAYELRISDWSSDVCSSDLGSPMPCSITYSAKRVSGSPEQRPRLEQRQAHHPAVAARHGANECCGTARYGIAARLADAFAGLQIGLDLCRLQLLEQIGRAHV